jgi:Fe-S cluster assembly protein SufD
MSTKKVVATRRRRQPAGFSGFSFTKEMVPDATGLLGEFRAKAWRTFTEMPYPTTKDEEWRRTDIRKLDGSFRLPVPDAYLDLPAIPDALSQPLAGDQPGGYIFMLPGSREVRLEAKFARNGIIFTDLKTANNDYPELLGKALGQIVKPDDGKFAALTAALAENGVFVYIPKGVQVEKPLHSTMWAAGEGLAHFSHLIIWVEDGASLTYVHETASPESESIHGGGQTLNGGIVEIHVGPGGRLRFVELQSLGKDVWNFTHERARVERDGNMEWIFGAVGSGLTKNFSDLDLIGPGASGQFSGFYFTDDRQHLDHDTQQNHLAPYTTSDLLFKGALKGESRSVWQGMIYVAPGAQNTDGYQANRNLILSSNARADSIPGLEILADDVRCTHGATVGKIDPDVVFYLRSRGLSQQEAERLVVEGFFEPIMHRIPFDGVRERFKRAIEIKMD